MGIAASKLWAMLPVGRNGAGAHFERRGGGRPCPLLYCAAMFRSKIPAGSTAEEFESRASTLRRIAAELRDPDDKAELLGIALAYEEDAARIRRTANDRS